MTTLLLSFLVATGVKEQNSVRIVTMIVIAAAVVIFVTYRIFRTRKNRRNKEFFEQMHDQRRTPPTR